MRMTLPVGAIVLIAVLSALPTTTVADDTGIPSWGNPEPLETDDSGDAFYPEIVFDDSDNAIAAWTQYDGSMYNIWSRRYVAGSGWEEAEMIEDDSSGNTSRPRVAIDSSGNAIAVWYQYSGSHSIWSNRYVPGRGWGTAELIEHDTLEPAFFPQIAMDSSGNAVVVWYQRNSSDNSNHVWSNRYVAGEGWGTAELIETDSAENVQSWKPRVAVDGEGNALAVWERDQGAEAEIWSNRYVVGTGWGTAQLIETNDSCCYDPQVVADSEGNAIAIWGGYTSGSEYIAVHSLWYSEYTDGTGWGTAEEVESRASNIYIESQLAIDSQGNAIAVWVHAYEPWSDLNRSLWSNRYVTGTGWETAVPIEGNHTGYPSYPRVVVDNLGNAFAIWVQKNITFGQVWVNRYVVGTGWETERLVTSTEEDCWTPTVAMDSSGNALAAWEQHNGYDEWYSVWWNRFGAPEEPSEFPSLLVGAAVIAIGATAVVVVYVFRLKRSPPKAQQP